MTPYPASDTETIIQDDQPKLLEFMRDIIPKLLADPTVGDDVKYHVAFTLLPMLNHYLNN